MRVTPFNPDKIDLNLIGNLVDLLKQGGIFICPTDTIYGLCADAFNEIAVRRIFKIKNRPKIKPLPIFVKDLGMAKGLAFVDNKQEEILTTLWPGQVTVILRKRNIVPDFLTGGGQTIGIRVPEFPFIWRLIEHLGRPLAETSANLSGEASSGDIKDIIFQFKKHHPQPDLVLDAGNLREIQPSTVLDLTQEKSKILRAGLVTKDQLSKFLNFTL